MKIFPVFYFPPISWFAAAAHEKEIVLDRHSHFRKQQLFNRMRIQDPNRILPLTLPVLRSGENTPLHQSRISYAEDWQKIHFRTLETAYRSSPYFEYYEDDISPFFTEKHEFLLDLSLKSIELVRGWLQLDFEFTLSDRYLGKDEVETDYRGKWDRTGKTHPDFFQPVHYPQIFRAFEEDLSVFDLVCNEGPQGRAIVLDSYKKPD
ncbi:MAG: WbqC family protein [Bacteroidia bacterium]|nr:WbqC family protein [Bacteroidia bacterium]